jgi:hypothetical protein
VSVRYHPLDGDLDRVLDEELPRYAGE